MYLTKLFLQTNIKKKDCISVLFIGALTVMVFNILPMVLQSIFYSFNKYGAFLMEYYTYKTIIKFIKIIFIGYFLYAYFNFAKSRGDLFYLYKLFGADRLEIIALNLTFGIIVYILSVLLGSLFLYFSTKILYIAINSMFDINSFPIKIDFSIYISTIIILGVIILLLSIYNSAYMLFNDGDRLYVESKVDKKHYNKNYKKDKIFAILLIIISFIFTTLYSLRVIPFNIGIVFYLFSFILGYTILMNTAVFSYPVKLRKNNKVIESIALDSSFNRHRKLNKIVVNSNTISAFILMYVFSIFLLSYWSSVLDKDIEKPYIYDALIVGDKIEDLKDLNIDANKVEKSVIFPSYTVQLGITEYNVTSESFYNKILDEKLHLNNGHGKLIETTLNNDNWIIYEGEKQNFHISSGEKNKDILINSLDGRYVFRGLVEWNDWVILSDEDFKELTPENVDDIHYSELIRYNANYGRTLTNEINDIAKKNDKISVYYKDVIVNLLKSSQKLMIITVALIVIAIKGFILYLYKIKIRNDFNFILEKYQLLDLLGMGSSRYRLLRKEIFLIYFKPAIITYLVVPLIAIFPFYIDIETEKSLASFLELTKFGVCGFGIIIMLFISFEIIVYLKISKNLTKKLKLKRIEVND